MGFPLRCILLKRIEHIQLSKIKSMARPKTRTWIWTESLCNSHQTQNTELLHCRSFVSQSAAKGLDQGFIVKYGMSVQETKAN